MSASNYSGTASHISHTALIIDWVRAAAREGGIWLALLVALLALGLTALARWNPVEEAADPLIGLVRSPADVRCLPGWTETTGTDPDGAIQLRVCTSPDKRYIVTVRENQAPVGFDAQRGVFLGPEETAELLR